MAALRKTIAQKFKKDVAHIDEDDDDDEFMEADEEEKRDRLSAPENFMISRNTMRLATEIVKNNHKIQESSFQGEHDKKSMKRLDNISSFN